MRKGWQKLVDQKDGFTVVELLIVIVVIAILASIVIVSYRGIVDKGHDSAAQAAVEQVSKKLLIYFQKNRTYPDDIASMGFVDTADTTYHYTRGGNAKTYCASVTNGEVSYYITDAGFTPMSGLCPAPALPNPIAAWNFNEGSGSTAADSSGNGYDLTAVGSTPWTAYGHTGAGTSPTLTKYFKRTGVGSGTLDAWTVTMWFKRAGNTATSYGQFLNDSSNFWMEMTQVGNWGFTGGYSPAALPTGDWHHLAWVLKPTSSSEGVMTFYLDGNYSHTKTYTSTDRLFVRSNTWMIGRGPGGSDGAVNGVIDDVRIYDTPLTEAQVKINKDL